MPLSVEDFWGELLSREPERIQTAWLALNYEEQCAIELHLNRMCTEEGWHPPQRESAMAALDVIAALK